MYGGPRSIGRPKRCWHSGASCGTNGRLKVESGSWGSYDCVLLWNVGQTVFIYWLEKES